MAMGVQLSGPIAPVPREGICVDIYLAPNCDMHPTAASRSPVMPALGGERSRPWVRPGRPAKWGGAQ